MHRDRADLRADGFDHAVGGDVRPLRDGPEDGQSKAIVVRRERKHLGKYDQTARYSLLVSIRTRKADIYTPITNVGTVQTEVMT